MNIKEFHKSIENDNPVDVSYTVKKCAELASSIGLPDHVNKAVQKFRDVNHLLVLWETETQKAWKVINDYVLSEKGHI